MKEIFDWLREQIANEINVPTLIRKDYDFDDGLIHAKDLINEAEAKWESDCCEWKQYETKYGTRYQNCRATEAPVDTFGFKYCPYCGKPIKISEVE